MSELMTMVIPAPSLVCDELPAVTVPFLRKIGFSLASASMEVPGRGPSSVVTRTVSSMLVPSGPGRRWLTGTGTISSANRPEAMAAKARS